MTRALEDLRSAIALSREGHPHWRCPQDLKLDIVLFTEKRRGQGAKLKDLAEDLGVSRSALERWMRKRRRQIRPVRIVEESRAVAETAGGEKLVLVIPGGYRLEGLGLETAAERIGRLGC